MKDDFFLIALNFIFDEGLFQLSGKKSCLFTTSTWQGTKVHVAYGSLSFWRHESLFCFSIGGPRFFPRYDVSMISKCFLKIIIIAYYRISQKTWSKDWLVQLKLIFSPSFEKSLEEQYIKIQLYIFIIYNLKYFKNCLWNLLRSGQSRRS